MTPVDRDAELNQLKALVEKLANKVNAPGDTPEARLGIVEDHVWFEDRWMVASLCDECLTTLCGLILG
jgi:hypothetical protein